MKRSTLFRFAVVVGVTVFLAVTEANAQHFANTTIADAANAALGANSGALFVNALAFNNGNPVDFRFTSFYTGQERDANGNHVRSFFYMPRHGYEGSNGVDFAQVLRVGTGDNAIDPLRGGTILQGIQPVFEMPNYTPGGGTAFTNNGDIAFWSTTTDLSFLPLPSLAPVESVTSGAVGYARSFGIPSVETGDVVPDLADNYLVSGFIRTSGSASNVSDTYFDSLRYSTFDALPLGGALTNFGSGSQVFLDDGIPANVDLTIGAMSAGVTLGNTRFSYYVNFTQAENHAIVEPYFGVTVVPEPAGLMFFVFAAASLRRRRAGRPSIGSTGDK